MPSDDEQGREHARGEHVRGEDENWRVVDAYLKLDRIGHDISSRRARGDHPPIELAVAAARDIVAQPGHARLVDAAVFLVEHPLHVEKTAAQDAELGLAALVAHLGPDWAVVERYQSRRKEWERQRLEAQAEPNAEQRKRRLDALSDERPKVFRALAVAKAVAAVEAHQERRRAAEFLVRNGHRMHDSGRLAIAGAELLRERFPDYDGWPSLLGSLEPTSECSGANEAIEKLFATLAETGEGMAQAVARLHSATWLMRAANELSVAWETRDGKRRQALELATGLSAGLEGEAFGRYVRYAEDGTPLAGTLAGAERELLFRLNHATAGGTLPTVAGRRIDGGDERLSAYAGKVVLIDFWATWCSPCVKALPTLRELNDELAGSSFTLLSISVDDELETVAGFQQDEPMPWVNWHVGTDSELGDAWGIRAYPTYILVDGDGVILAHTNALSKLLLDYVRDSVGENDIDRAT